MKKILLSFFALMALSVAIAAVPPRQALVSWGAVTTDTEGGAISGVTYKLYRGPAGTGIIGKTAIASNLTVLSYTDTDVAAGKTDCYNVSAVANSIEGDPSVEGCKSYPALGPAAVPSISVQ